MGSGMAVMCRFQGDVPVNTGAWQVIFVTDDGSSLICTLGIQGEKPREDFVADGVRPTVRIQSPIVPSRLPQG